jgi:hypothetical protein
MQKVEGSNPFSRLLTKPAPAGRRFCFCAAAQACTFRAGPVSYDFLLISSDTVGSVACMALKNRTIDSNEVRVQTPEIGEALLVQRYGQGRLKAVVLHPEDFAELCARAELLDQVSATGEATELAIATHHRAEAPEGEVVEDEASVRALLGI